jgi:hypothetical protein
MDPTLLTHPVLDATGVETEYAGSIEPRLAPRPSPHAKLCALVLLLARATACEIISSSGKDQVVAEPTSNYSGPTTHPAGAP